MKHLILLISVFSAVVFSAQATAKKCEDFSGTYKCTMQNQALPTFSVEHNISGAARSYMTVNYMNHSSEFRVDGGSHGLIGSHLMGMNVSFLKNTEYKASCNNKTGVLSININANLGMVFTDEGQRPGNFNLKATLVKKDGQTVLLNGKSRGDDSMANREFKIVCNVKD